MDYESVVDCHRKEAYLQAEKVHLSFVNCFVEACGGTVTMGEELDGDDFSDPVLQAMARASADGLRLYGENYLNHATCLTERRKPNGDRFKVPQYRSLPLPREEYKPHEGEPLTFHDLFTQLADHLANGDEEQQEAAAERLGGVAFWLDDAMAVDGRLGLDLLSMLTDGKLSDVDDPEPPIVQSIRAACKKAANL